MYAIRSYYGLDEGLAGVDEDLGAALGEGVGAVAALGAVVVDGEDVLVAGVALADREGLGAVAVGVVDVEEGVGAGLVAEEDVVARITSYNVCYTKLLRAR